MEQSKGYKRNVEHTGNKRLKAVLKYPRFSRWILIKTAQVAFHVAWCGLIDDASVRLFLIGQDPQEANSYCIFGTLQVIKVLHARAHHQNRKWEAKVFRGRSNLILASASSIFRKMLEAEAKIRLSWTYSRLQWPEWTLPKRLVLIREWPW